MALSATAIIVFGLTLAAWFVYQFTFIYFQLPCDFTSCGAFLLAMMLGLICLGILNIFFYTQFMNTLYASLGAIVMSMYIVFDTQVYIYDNIILLLDLNDRKKTKYSWTR